MKEQTTNSPKPRERQSRNNKTSSYSNKKYSKRGGERSPQRAGVQIDSEKNREKSNSGSIDLSVRQQNELNKNNANPNSNYVDNSRKKTDKNFEHKKNKYAKRNKREFQSIDEIKSDISRIEKEIYLEIAEFRNITLD